MPPDPDRHAIAFAEKLLTLLDEGAFVATYKYAVLLGLMDLCLEYSTKGGGAPTSVTTHQLAEEVLALYWPHAIPFTGLKQKILLQNQSSQGSGQAAIIKLIVDFRTKHGVKAATTLTRARRSHPKAFQSLVRNIEWKLVEMPLPRLQRIGDSDVPFIYRINWDRTVKKGEFNDATGFDNSIRFIGAAGDHLVRLAGLLRPLIQRSWAAMVARLNRDAVEDAELEEFLFGVDRVSLASVRESLRELQDERCFYCAGKLAKEAEVDHFVPWARFPDNGLANLVVADPRCNNDKRDHLASAEHVRAWTDRASAHEADLIEIAKKKEWDHRPERTFGVARAIYLRLPTDSPLWHARGKFVPINRQLLQRALA